MESLVCIFFWELDLWLLEMEVSFFHFEYLRDMQSNASMTSEIQPTSFFFDCVVCESSPNLVNCLHQLGFAFSLISMQKLETHTFHI